MTATADLQTLLTRARGGAVLVVGDLMLECDVTVTEPKGAFVLEVSRGIHRYQARFDPPISNGKYTFEAHDRCVIRVHTDRGLAGIGLGHGGTGLRGAPRMIAATVDTCGPR